MHKITHTCTCYVTWHWSLSGQTVTFNNIKNIHTKFEAKICAAVREKKSTMG